MHILNSRIILAILTLAVLQSIPFFQVKNCHSFPQEKEGETKGVIKDDIETITQFTNKFFARSYNKIRICDSRNLTKWEVAEKKRHEQAIANANYDIIIVPLQDVRASDDRIGRLMAARFVADEVEKVTGKRVLSPELLLRYLGRNQILFNPEEIEQLAKNSSAQFIYLFKRMKKNRGGNSRIEDVEIAAVLTDESGKIIKDYFSNIGFYSDSYHSILFDEKVQKNVLLTPQPTVEMQINQLKSTLTAKLFPNAKSKYGDRENKPETLQLDFPPKISHLPGLADTPLQNALYLQLLAMLTPEIMQYERWRLFERSLIAVNNGDPSNKYHRLLKARALFHLYRRPYTLDLLDAPQTPEEKALKEVINGNYAKLDQHLGKIDNPLLHALAIIEKNQLHYSYRSDKLENTAFKVPNSQWFELISYLCKGKSGWHAPDSLQFFTSIKGLYPKFDKKLERVLLGKTIVMDGQTNLDSYKMIADILGLPNEKSALDSTPLYGSSITDVDIWQLYRNISISNMLKKIRRSAWILGTYDSAVRASEEFQPYLEGFSPFSYFYAYSLYKQAFKLTGTTIQENYDRAVKLINDIFLYSCSVTRYTNYASQLSGSIKLDNPRKEHSVTPTLPNEYSLSISSGCYPTRFVGSTYWSEQYLSLPFTHDNLDALEIVSEKMDTDYVLGELNSRFHGHPKKATMHAEYLIKAGKKKKGMQLLQVEVNNHTKNWNSYKTLGQLQIEDNADEARKTFLKYPLFIDPSVGHSVAVSNEAYWAGNLFYYKGYFEEAKEFYRIATDLQTGAGSQYVASQKLSLLDRDFNRLLKYTHIAAKRYNDSNSYNLLLTYLHILRLHKDSNAAFELLLKRSGNEIIWNSHLTGNRIEKKTSTAIANALESLPSLPAITKQLPQKMAANCLLDRKPAAEDLFHIKEFEKGTQLKIVGDHSLQPAVTKFSKGVYKIFEEISAAKGMNSVNISGSYEWFAKIYAKFLGFGSNIALPELLKPYLKIGRPDDRHIITGHRVVSQTPADPVMFYALPYLTGCLLDVLDESQLKRYEHFIQKGYIDHGGEAKRIEEYCHDFALALFIIKTHQGDIDGALSIFSKTYKKLLKDSIYLEDHRALPKYFQILQIAEWASKKIQKNEFLQIVLKELDDHLIRNPHLSYAHAFKAIYSTNKQEKVEAAAHSLYLDSQSWWLKQVDEAILEEAEVWWSKNNPYSLEKNKEQSQTESSST